MRLATTEQRFEDPPWLMQLFGNPLFGFGWFLLRIFLGMQWLDSGLHQVTGSRAVGWVKDGTVKGKPVHTGDSILASWRSAVGAGGQPPRVTFEWYQDLLKF